MDAQWLNAQFANDPEKSKADLARILGLEAPAVSKMLNGTRQIKATEYVRMREFFGLTNDGDKSVVNTNNYIIKPLEKSGLNDLAGDQGEWVMPADIIAEHTNAPSDKIKIFSVRENMMQPDFNKGEHVIVDLTDKTPSPPGVFIVSDGFGTLVRQCEFVAGSKPTKFKISAISDKFQPQILLEDDFKILGRVIAKLQWI